MLINTLSIAELQDSMITQQRSQSVLHPVYCNYRKNLQPKGEIERFTFDLAMLNSMLNLLDAILDKYMILRKGQETDTYGVQICYIKVFVESIYIYSAENLAI